MKLGVFLRHCRMGRRLVLGIGFFFFFLYSFLFKVTVGCSVRPWNRLRSVRLSLSSLLEPGRKRKQVSERGHLWFVIRKTISLPSIQVHAYLLNCVNFITVRWTTRARADWEPARATFAGVEKIKNGSRQNQNNYTRHSPVKKRSDFVRIWFEIGRVGKVDRDSVLGRAT